MLDSPIVLVTLCYYGLSKNELPIFIKSEKLLKIYFAESNTCKSGGDNRDRTGNPQLAKLVLSQLSYIPNSGGPIWNRTRDLRVISTAL